MEILREQKIWTQIIQTKMTNSKFYRDSSICYEKNQGVYLFTLKTPQKFIAKRASQQAISFRLLSFHEVLLLPHCELSLFCPPKHKDASHKKL